MVILVPITIKVFSAEITGWGQLVWKGGLLAAGYILAIWAAFTVSGMFYVLAEWERLVLLRLGRFVGVKGPGLFIVPPFIYSAAAIVDVWVVSHPIKATTTLTKDNVPVEVTAAIELRVEDAEIAIVRVKDFLQTVEWTATEALKTMIGSNELRDLLSEQETLGKTLKQEIDKEAAAYGVDVKAVRITDVVTPTDLMQELAVVAREQRSAEGMKIRAEAGVEVAKLTKEAAEILAEVPDGMELRRLQVLAEMSKEEGTMVVVYPMDMGMGRQIAAAAAGAVGAKGKK